MEPNFEVDENVYIKAKILSVYDQTDDIRYEMQTMSGASRIFAKQTKDTIKRSPEDVDNSEGENIFLDYCKKIAAMTPDEITEAFTNVIIDGKTVGGNYKDLNALITNSEYDAPTIIKLYDNWVLKNNIDVNSIVMYRKADDKDSEAKKCVVLKVTVDKQQASDGSTKENKTYLIYHHDEENDIHEFIEAKREDITNLEVAVNIDPYFDTLGNAIDVTQGIDNSNIITDKKKKEDEKNNGK